MSEVSAAVVNTPIGEIVVAERDGKLACCCLREHFRHNAKALGLPARMPLPDKPKTAALGRLTRKLKQYFSGDVSALSGVERTTRGTDFQEQVWKALARIRPGDVRSYTEVAKRISRPGASRAVGTACGKNPFLLFVPCHRVIASNGKLGGFSAGLHRKVHLLAHEGIGHCVCCSANDHAF